MLGVTLALTACSPRAEGAHDVAAGDADADAARGDVDACTPSEPLEEPPASCRALHVRLDVIDDTHAQPLFAEAVEVVMPDCEAPVLCAPLSTTSFSCELPGDFQLADPIGSEQTSLEVIARVDGHAQRARAELLIDYNALDQGRACSYDGSVSVPLPDCADDGAVAVEGQLLSLAQDATAQVRLWPAWRSDGVFWDLQSAHECEVDGAVYRCSASGYRGRYVLEAVVGSEIVAQRDVSVQTDGCALQTLHYDLELAPLGCDLEVWLGTDARASAGVASVRLDATDSEPGVACQRSELAPHLFRCPLGASALTSSRRITFESQQGLTLTKAMPPPRTCPAIFPMRSSTVTPQFGVPTVVLRHPDLRALGLLE